MIVRVNRIKVLSRAALLAGIISLWMLLVCGSAIWAGALIEQLTHQDLTREKWTLLGYLALFAAVIAWGSIRIVRKKLQGNLEIGPRAIRLNDRDYEVLGPACVARYRDSGRPLKTSLALPSNEGTLLIEDDYELPLDRLRDMVNDRLPAARSDRKVRSFFPTTGDPGADAVIAKHVTPATGESFLLRDRGGRWHVSMGWAIGIPTVLYAAYLMFAGMEITGRIFHLLPELRWPALLGALGLSILPWLSFILADPSYRAPSWAHVNRDWIVVVHDGIWILPTCSVKDVSIGLASVEMRCANGVRIRYPDASLAHPLGVACGIDPNRRISVTEAARLLDCSLWKAYWILLLKVGIPADRKKFFERYPHARTLA